MSTTASMTNGAQRPAHVRAEELLAELEDTSDPAACRAMRQEAVVLTMDIADGVARRFTGRGIDTDDLVQVARLALVKAVRGFRSGRGNSFAAYAVPTIAGEIKRHFRDVGWSVRPPRRLQELRAEVVAQEEVLRHSLGREPSRAETASALGLPTAEVGAAIQCSTAYHSLSLDHPLLSGSDAPVADADVFDGVLSRDVLLRALGSLSERERRIVRLRFVEELTQSQIGERVGVSQMQVSRLLSRIIARLQAELGDPPVNGAATVRGAA